MHPPLIRTAINIGAIYGLSSFAIFLILHYAGLNPLSSSSLIGFWTPLLFVIISIRYYRNYEGGGFINYWRAFRVGLLTIVCGALLYSLLLYLFGTIGATDLVDNYKEQMFSQMEETEGLIKGIFGEKMQDMAMESINNTTLRMLASTDFFYKCLGGAFLSLIVAAFLKRNPPTDLVI